MTWWFDGLEEKVVIGLVTIIFISLRRIPTVKDEIIIRWQILVVRMNYERCRTHEGGHTFRFLWTIRSSPEIHLYFFFHWKISSLLCLGDCLFIINGGSQLFDSSPWRSTALTKQQSTEVPLPFSILLSQLTFKKS